jgi:vitamin B12 transporter
MHLLLATALLVAPADTLRLPDLVSTATRLPLRAEALAGSHTVLWGDDLRERGILHLLDALREIPGLVTVQAGSYGSATSVFLRGGESDFVKVLLDGVPMNASGGAFNFANLTIENIERIEVTRGPASVLHGADAMTGVIQLFTAEGRGQLRTTAVAEAGGLGNRSGSARIQAAGRAGTLSAHASGFWSDGSYPFNNDYRNQSVSLHAGTAAGRQTGGNLTLRYGGVRAAFPTNSAGVPVDSNQYLTERQLALGAGVSRRLGEALVVRLGVTASRTLDGFEDQPDHPGDHSGFGFAASRSGRSQRTGSDLRATWAGRGPLMLTVGAAYEDERQRQEGTTTSDFGEGPFIQADSFRAGRSTRSVYAEAASEVSRALTLSGGVRADDNSAFGTDLTWRVGVAFHPAAGLTLRGQAGRAYKAPTFAELFARSPFEVGDPGLQPERARSWEVGAEQRMAGGRLRLAAAYFNQRFTDLIQYTPAAPGEPTYGNVSAATSHGAEVELSAVVVRGVTIAIQGSAVKTTVTDAGGSTSLAWQEGERLIRRPARSGAVSLRWQPASGVTFRAGLHHLGARDDLDFSRWPAERVTLPARTTTDLAAVVALGRWAPGITLRGRVDNLFDVRWEEVAGFKGRGRLLMLGAGFSR